MDQFGSRVRNLIGSGTLLGATLALSACRDVRGIDQPGGASGTDSSVASTSQGTPSSGGAASGTDSTDDNAKFDLGAPDGGPLTPVDMCKVQPDGNAVGACDDVAPPDSFEPAVQWTWEGGFDQEDSVVVTPLVGNLTDDNDDGTIDLCDTPDVVVVASTAPFQTGHIYVLDGASGEQHLRFDAIEVDENVTPALGDIDNDGIPEVVAVTINPPDREEFGGYLVAFEHDGTLKWVGDTPWDDGIPNPFSNEEDYAWGSVTLADLDADGDVEIITGNMVSDHQGQLLWFASEPPGDYSSTVAVDLDGDDDLEVVLGHAAFDHDGSPLWIADGVEPGFPNVADLDSDGEPEVLVTSRAGLALLEHDGTVKYLEQRPTGAPVFEQNWIRPATIHDFDGDGAAEFAVSSRIHYTVYEGNGSIVWDASVVDETGVAGSTAFDFLGDGSAEAMYADEESLHIFDASGTSVLEVERRSVTGTEYPVVADVDNDGSAEIIVVSNWGHYTHPPVQVIRDIDDRWIAARRIWNQHAYHVTNVREDGTIPQVQPKSWEQLNTFRTNAQIEGGSVCAPTPVG